MKIVKINLYTGLPFFICSLFAVFFKYTTLGGGIFDFSGIIVLFSFGFFGIILFITNLLLFIRLKSKQILNRIGIYQAAHLISYIILCIVSNIYIKAYRSYNLAFLMPIIIFAFITTLNLIIYVHSKNKKGREIVFNKVSLIACVLLLCVSTGYYYIRWTSCRERAQIWKKNEAWSQWHTEDWLCEDFEIHEGDNMKRYRLFGSKSLDKVTTIYITEYIYFNDEQEEKEIHQYLRELPCFSGDYEQCKVFSPENARYFYWISCVLGEQLSDDYPPCDEITEELLNKRNPMIKDVTVNGKISYSKLKQLFLNNNYVM